MGRRFSTPEWPGGRHFAFTILDDTDRANVENVRSVYEFLHKKGFRITKTVWPLRPSGRPITGGQSLEETAYRDWILELKNKGFEIALHGVADGSSDREQVVAGLNLFKRVIGHPPAVHANHAGQSEGIYWGADRFDGAVKLAYVLARKLYKGGVDSQGHLAASKYFWGDLCSENISFVRNLVFKDINTLKMDPLMPYHDPRRPHVRFWFSSSDGATPDAFCRLLSERNQDRLLREHGACIVYTHFGAGFWEDGRLNERFVELMSRLAELPGWFVPVSVLLNYIGASRGWPSLNGRRQVLRRMQWRWLIQKVFR